MQKKSAAGSSNRAQLRYNHLGGSKSIIQHLEEIKTDTSRSSSSSTSSPYVELFKSTHWSEEKGWISNEAETDYNRILEARGERLSQLPGEVQLELEEEEEIYSQVLSTQKNEKYGYKRGTGPVPRMRKESNSRGSTHYEALSKKVESLENDKLEYSRRITDMEEQIRQSNEQIRQSNEMLRKFMYEFHPHSDHPTSFSHPPDDQPPPPPPPAAPLC